MTPLPQPAGRRRYTEEVMLDAGRRPMGRLFCWALIGAASLGWISALGATPQNSPGTTNVQDTVYLADGTTATGSLIITWPAFVSSGGAAIAAGSTSTTLGANGALSVALVPNAGASPAGVYYTVVYQLGPGEVKTEYWVVPAASTANLSQVRTTPGSGVAGQPVSMQYVNSALAAKADDAAVVHVNGSETISGAKTFSSSPSVPAPTHATDIATKGYVDSSVTNVGGGSYLPTAGGTMTGPITLPGSLYAGKSGAEKKDAAMTFLENALQTVDTFAQRDVVDAVKFREGISKVIDGTVECLNASAWAKGSSQPSAVSHQ